MSGHWHFYRVEQFAVHRSTTRPHSATFGRRARAVISLARLRNVGADNRRGLVNVAAESSAFLDGVRGHRLCRARGPPLAPVLAYSFGTRSRRWKKIDRAIRRTLRVIALVRMCRRTDVRGSLSPTSTNHSEMIETDRESERLARASTAATAAAAAVIDRAVTSTSNARRPTLVRADTSSSLRCWNARPTDAASRGSQRDATPSEATSGLIATGLMTMIDYRCIAATAAAGRIVRPLRRTALIREKSAKL